MKLFVTNKDVFDNDFPSSQKEIHRKAFNQLLNSLGSSGKAPKEIRLDFDMWFITLTFVNEINNVYFYSYERW